MPIHGWLRDCQSNYGVRGYSDIGGRGGGIGVPIQDGPGTVRVTMVYRDTLT